MEITLIDGVGDIPPKSKDYLSTQMLPARLVTYGLTDEFGVGDSEGYAKQRQERGFDDTELWSLDGTILRFALPRLKVFRSQVGAVPPKFATIEEWYACLDSMIEGIEEYLEDGNSTDVLKPFFENFKWLWD